MRRIALAMIITAGLLIAAAVATATPGTGTRSGAGTSAQCGNVVFTPQGQDGAFWINADRTTCQTAKQVAAGSRPQNDTHGRPSYSALGFRCRGVGGQLGGSGKYVVRFSCTHNAAHVRFLRG